MSLGPLSSPKLMASLLKSCCSRGFTIGLVVGVATAAAAGCTAGGLNRELENWLWEGAAGGCWRPGLQSGRGQQSVTMTRTWPHPALLPRPGPGCLCVNSGKSEGEAAISAGWKVGRVRSWPGPPPDQISCFTHTRVRFQFSALTFVTENCVEIVCEGALRLRLGLPLGDV